MVEDTHARTHAHAEWIGSFVSSFVNLYRDPDPCERKISAMLRRKRRRRLQRRE
eukprot:jgi/Psemu1/310562/fgenesh1_kg.653_\